MDNSKTNYQEIANVAIKLLHELNQGEIKATAEIKEQANLIGKITNIFKGKLVSIFSQYQSCLGIGI